VVAANHLAGKLQFGIVQTQDLAAIQKERELPTRVIQTFQTFLQRLILVKVLQANTPFQAPLPLRLLQHVPLLRALPARLIGFGLRHVRVNKQLL
jgi:hypothetical protein